MISRSNLVRTMLAVAACATPLVASATAHATLPGNGYQKWAMGADRLTIGTMNNNQETTANHTCFLSGVAGMLAAGDPASFRGPSVGVYEGADAYYLKVDPGQDYDGNDLSYPMEVHAVCLNVVATTTAPVVPLTANTSYQLAPSYPGRQCFLQAISGGYGLFQTDSAKVWVEEDSGHWYLKSANTAPSAYGNATASAVCVDIPNVTVSTPPFTGSIPDAEARTVSFGWVETASTPVAIGLTELSGQFTGNTNTDGVLLTSPQSDPGQWSLHIENGKTCTMIEMK